MHKGPSEAAILHLCDLPLDRTCFCCTMFCELGRLS